MNFRASLVICVASSRVGVIMIPIGPSSGSKAGWSSTWRKSGSRKASVFPEPVLAMPIMSRPDIIMGSACAWIGVGRSKPFFLRHS